MRWCRRCWSAGLPALPAGAAARAARRRAGAARRRRTTPLVERLAHHFVEALPGRRTRARPPLPGRRRLAARRAAGPRRGRGAHPPGAAAARPGRARRRPHPARPAHRARQRPAAQRPADRGARGRRRGDHRRPPARRPRLPGPGRRRLGQRDRLELAAARHGGRRHGRPARGPDRRAGRRRGATTALTARLLGTLGIELAFGPDDRGRAGRRSGRSTLARRIGDPELLGRTLNNFSIAVWGRPGAAEVRLAAADESLELAGHGLPRRTEFVAHLHRAALRLHLGDLAGFEADHAQARRLAVSLSGPEVRPHVLWQAGGLAWLRGNAARAEELTTEAYELFRQGDPARPARLRRAPVHAAPGRLPAGRRDPAAGRDRRRGQPAAAGDGGAGRGGVRRPRRGPAAARRAGAARWSATGPATSRSTCRRSRRLARRRARLGGGRGVAAALPRAAGGARDAVAHPRRLRRAARPDRRAPWRPGGRAGLVAVGAASRACSSARRTRWHWPTRTSPAWPPRV